MSSTVFVSAGEVSVTDVPSVMVRAQEGSHHAGSFVTFVIADFQLASPSGIANNPPTQLEDYTVRLVASGLSQPARSKN